MKNTKAARALGAAAVLALTTSAWAAPRALDPAKSQINFSIKQMGVAVSGQFKKFEAQVDLDEAAPENTAAQVTVSIASLTTGNADADEIALDTPWLDRLGFPTAQFKSTAIKALGGDRYEASGTLTIRGNSRNIRVPMQLKPQDGGAVVASGEFTLVRTDFGIGGGEWNEGDLVAAQVPVTFSLWLDAP
ncbi:YceI family protein [Sinimarinibacterium sp. NLF-5-8]|uniref:YceI family protein n=1 Tax=Sinimarinibacterium sp. NLF-5-8 TaxID=2698684 RepID=UPI00137BA233|nr:YceI family protein [Sinimarinibacterium sp. NLF-5-8]QHS10802.1 YceI family protein [Sinimarinibacterium sp. NLF-5-8]